MTFPGQDETDYVGLPDDDDLEPIALVYEDTDIGDTIDEPTATQLETTYLESEEVPA